MYCYELTASSVRGGEGMRSASVTVTAVTVGKPTGLTVTAVSETSISLSWSAPADDGGGPLDGYNVYRCAGEDCVPDEASWLAWITDVTGVHGRRQRRAAADGRYAIPVCGGGKSGSGRERLVRPGDGHCGDADGAGGADRLDGAGDRIEGGGELERADADRFRRAERLHPVPGGRQWVRQPQRVVADHWPRPPRRSMTPGSRTGPCTVTSLLRAACGAARGLRSASVTVTASDSRQAHRADGHRSQRNFNQPELERPGGRWRRAIGRLQRVPLCGRRFACRMRRVGWHGSPT